MGAWSYMDRRIEDLLRRLDIKANRPGYAGRAESAATATGLLRRHNREQAALIDEALTVVADAGAQEARAGAQGPTKAAPRRSAKKNPVKKSAAKKGGRLAAAKQRPAKAKSTRQGKGK